MRKGEIVTGSLSGLGFIAALDAYVGTGTSSWLADICFTGDTPPPMVEGMPMEENHSKHAAYFASSGLTFLAAALGWEYMETQAAKVFQSAPQGTARKRVLACIIYVATAANRANRRVIEETFTKATGHALAPSEAKEAFDYLMRENAPELDRILGGASGAERRRLLQSVILTWSEHGMDSEKSTKITEYIVDLLGFNDDDMRKTLDLLWLKERTHTFAGIAWRTGGRQTRKVTDVFVRGTKVVFVELAPHCRNLVQRFRRALRQVFAPRVRSLSANPPQR